MRTVAPVFLVLFAAGCAGGPSITDVAAASGVSVGGVDSRVITGAAKTVAALNTHIDTGDEIRLGRAAAARILGRYGRWADAKRTEYVNLVGQGLVQSVGREDLTYYFALLDTDEVVALSSPGGYVFISRGTLRLMKNEAELAAVLGHEIAHINERHVLREIEKRYVVDAAAGTAMAAASSDSATIGAIRMGGPAFSKLADFAVGVVFKGYPLVGGDDDREPVAPAPLLEDTADLHGVFVGKLEAVFCNRRLCHSISGGRRSAPPGAQAARHREGAIRIPWRLVVRAGWGCRRPLTPCTSMGNRVRYVIYGARRPSGCSTRSACRLDCWRR